MEVNPDPHRNFVKPGKITQKSKLGKNREQLIIRLYGFDLLYFPFKPVIAGDFWDSLTWKNPGLYCRCFDLRLREHLPALLSGFIFKSERVQAVLAP
jgi:hypothetical protein